MAQVPVNDITAEVHFGVGTYRFPDFPGPTGAETKSALLQSLAEDYSVPVFSENVHRAKVG